MIIFFFSNFETKQSSLHFYARAAAKFSILSVRIHSFRIDVDDDTNQNNMGSVSYSMYIPFFHNCSHVIYTSTVFFSAIKTMSFLFFMSIFNHHVFLINILHNTYVHCYQLGVCLRLCLALTAFTLCFSMTSTTTTTTITTITTTTKSTKSNFSVII